MSAGVFFQTPWMLWLVVPVITAGLLYLFRGRDRLLVISRIVVICLLIIALANPYAVVSHTKDVKRPRITILSDQTESTRIFDLSAAERLQAALPDSQVRYISGESTPLGDRILQYSLQGDSILLVSDGNSNSGRPLGEALVLARSSNNTVFALEIEPVKADAGVEISGTSTAVLGGDYPFKVIVHSAAPGGAHPEGRLEVYTDDEKINEIDLGSFNESIRISHRFTTTGTHIIKAVISPVDDLERANNEFIKTVYVVPKPKVLLLTDRSSPLQTVLADLFDISVSSEIPPDLKGYKAVVLDDKKHDPSLDSLREYVREGGGLVVVGGPDAYELGGYYNSTLERALPVVSAPSIFQGGKVLIIIMDISGSTMAPMKAGESATFLDYEKSLAIELLRSPELRDARVAVVVFGTRAYVVSNPVPLAAARSGIEESIKSLQTPIGKDETNLDDGLKFALEIRNATKGDCELVVISDGRLEPDKLRGDSVFQRSAELIREINATTTLIQVQSFEGSAGRLDSLAAETGSVFYPAVYPSSLTVHTEEGKIEPIEETEPPESGYPLLIYNQLHYITKDLKINATINGFNDVTPRPGAQRLVTMADGKPVLSVMRYGLGRSVAISTDDGNAWAPSIYSAENSMLISSAVNWAVGDPRPEGERIDAADAWKGSPVEITIISASPPAIESDQPIKLESVGDGIFQATLTPTATGVYYIGDYGISVNYPLEYRDIGYNPSLRGLIEANGGRIFTEEEARRNLVQEARRASERTVEERVSQRMPLIFAALAIFLVSVIWRRFAELRKGG